MNRLAKTAVAAAAVGVLADVALAVSEGKSARRSAPSDHVGAVVVFGALSLPCIAIYQGVEWLTRPR